VMEAGDKLLDRRPRERGDPYAAAVRFEAVVVATFFLDITAGGYGPRFHGDDGRD
jgi:hypothetical protein